MNKKAKVISKTALMTLGVMSVVPNYAHADSGVIREDLVVETENGEIELSIGDRVDIVGSEESSYVVSIGESEQAFSVDKDKMLKTHVDEESHLQTIDKNVVLKSAPDIFSEVIQTVSIDAELERVEITDEDELQSVEGWVKVRTIHNIEGWIEEKALEAQLVAVSVTQEAYIVDDSLSEHEVEKGDSITIRDIEDGKYVVVLEEEEVSVPIDSVSFTKPVFETATADTPSGTPVSYGADVSGHPVGNGQVVDAVLEEAFKHIGKPYVWGAVGPNGFDCSGFTQQVLAKNGISIPRVTFDQARVGVGIPRNELAAGDLLFFETYTSGPSHVGFYIGDGKMIHAGGKQIHVADINSSYYSSRYLFARRVIQ